MRTWVRTPLDRRCGGPCQDTIPKGSPMLLIRPATLGRDLVRCVRCAGDTPPADLPPLVERSIPTFEPQPLVRAGTVKLPFDFKLAQVAREPGEEG